jgi:hypothetical protein
LVGKRKFEVKNWLSERQPMSSTAKNAKREGSGANPSLPGLKTESESPIGTDSATIRIAVEGFAEATEHATVTASVTVIEIGKWLAMENVRWFVSGRSNISTIDFAMVECGATSTSRHAKVKAELTPTKKSRNVWLNWCSPTSVCCPNQYEETSSANGWWRTMTDMTWRDEQAMNLRSFDRAAMGPSKRTSPLVTQLTIRVTDPAFSILNMTTIAFRLNYG